MSKAFSIVVEGDEAITRKLQALPAIFTREAVLEALTTAGKPMRDMARQKAPRSDSAPHMADSIDFAPVGRDEMAIALGPGRKFFYGRYQEFGTVHHAAQPFLRPAFDSLATSTIDAVGRQFWALIKGAV